MGSPRPRADRPARWRAMGDQVGRYPPGRAAAVRCCSACSPPPCSWRSVAKASTGSARRTSCYDLGFPSIATPVVWLGAMSIVATVGSMGLTEVIRRRADLLSPAAVGRALTGLQAVRTVLVLVFALAGQFWLAAATWLVSELRARRGPAVEVDLDGGADRVGDPGHRVLGRRHGRRGRADRRRAAGRPDRASGSRSGRRWSPPACWPSGDRPSSAAACPAGRERSDPGGAGRGRRRAEQSRAVRPREPRPATRQIDSLGSVWCSATLIAYPIDRGGTHGRHLPRGGRASRAAVAARRHRRGAGPLRRSARRDPAGGGPGRRGRGGRHPADVALRTADQRAARRRRGARADPGRRAGRRAGQAEDRFRVPRILDEEA